MYRSRMLLVGAAALFAVAGCYEPADVTLNEPGVYKGPHDPLLSKSADERREELIQRFNLVQRDR